MGTLTSGNIKAGALGTGLIPASNTYVSSGTAVYDQIYYNSGGQEMETFDFSENGLQPGEAFVYEKSAAGKLQGYDGFCIVSDESDGSQKFIDLGPNKFKVAAQADVHHESGGGKFKHNPTSIYFDGTGDYLHVEKSSALGQTWYDDWTFECWFQSTGTSGQETIWAIDDYYYIWVTSFHDDGMWGVGYYNNTKVVDFPKSGKDAIERDGNWHHHATVRHGSQWTQYLDGVSVATYYYAGPHGRYTGPSSGNTGDFFIGHVEYDSSTDKFTGYMDDIRFIRGKAVYTQNFIPPSRSPKDTRVYAGVSDYTKITMMGYREDSSSYFTAINYIAGDEVVARDYMGIPHSHLQAAAYSGDTQKILIYNNL